MSKNTTCPFCQQIARDGDVYCRTCGTRLDGPSSIDDLPVDLYGPMPLYGPDPDIPHPMLYGPAPIPLEPEKPEKQIRPLLLVTLILLLIALMALAFCLVYIYFM